MDREQALAALRRTIGIIEMMDGLPLQAMAIVAPPDGSVVEIVSFGTEISNEMFAQTVANNLGRAIAAGSGGQATPFVGMPRR